MESMWLDLIHVLKNQGIEFQAGLSDQEVYVVEIRHGFRFPQDLREFLQFALPVGDGFPNWRGGDPFRLDEWLNRPAQGILFDIQHNGFWLEEWGPIPANLDEALQTAKKLIDQAPRLIPIYRHRMMPAEPNQPGNPIFSVHQTDIIYYGIDLRDYLIHEFLITADIGIWPIPRTVRKIRFWDVERFLHVRWSKGPCVFDNSSNTLP